MAFGRKSSFLRPAPRTKAPEYTYKDVDVMKKYLNPHGQILSRKRTGFDNQDQTNLKKRVKQARHLGLLPFAG